jgi:eukaryotic-like serine/threonine-protein kinase
MLAGQPPHLGGSAQQIIMKIITEQAPSVTTLRKSVPSNVADALQKALEKLPADRFASAKDFGDAITDARFTTGHASARAPGRRTIPGSRMTTLAGVSVVAFFSTFAGWLMRGATTHAATPLPIRFTTIIGRPGLDRPLLILSADGRRILQPVTDSSGTPRLGLRDLGSNTLTTIAGTERATVGAFSPNGEWVAFISDNKLRKVALQGGPVGTLFDSVTVDNAGIVWTPDGDIIFTVRTSGLWRVPAEGGSRVQITRVDSARREFAHWYPQLLPSGHVLIYTNHGKESRIEAVDLKTGRTTVLVEDAVFGRYSPTGHLLFARDAAVFAISFDPERLTVAGAAAPVQDGVAWERTNALAAYDIAPNGTFVYLRDSEWASDATVVWRDRTGRDTPAIETPNAYDEPRLSPDGRWIAITVAKPKLAILLYDNTRRVLTPLTRAPAAAFNALWMPDSKTIAYSYENPAYDLHLMSVDASTPDRVLHAKGTDMYLSSVSRDGRTILVTDSPGRTEILELTVDGSVKPKSLTEAGVEQRYGMYSPDGKRIAFTEIRDGRSDVYLRSAAGDGGRRLVSAGGGSQPRWTKGGREIVYLAGAEMMSATIDPATGEPGAPKFLFRAAIEPSAWSHSYDVTPDGERFLMVKRIERDGAQPLVVTLNWRPDFVGVGAKK